MVGNEIYFALKAVYQKLVLCEKAIDHFVGVTCLRRSVLAPINIKRDYLPNKRIIISL